MFVPERIFRLKESTRTLTFVQTIFFGGSGLTHLNPDPYSASVWDKDIEKLSKKRKPPKDRDFLPPTKPKRTKFETSITNTESNDGVCENSNNNAWYYCWWWSSSRCLFKLIDLQKVWRLTQFSKLYSHRLAYNKGIIMAVTAKTWKKWPVQNGR